MDNSRQGASQLVLMIAFIIVEVEERTSDGQVLRKSEE